MAGADPSTDRRRTSGATREALLEATRHLLASGESVAKLSAERIAEEAGMSRATFYLHFSAKSELIAALADELFSWRDEAWVFDLGASRVTYETVVEMMREITTSWSDNRATLSAIIELAEYDESIRAAWLGAMTQIADRASTQFERHWEGSRSRPPDPALVAETFTWMFERSCHQVLRDPGKADALAEALAEIVWRTLDHPGREPG